MGPVLIDVTSHGKSSEKSKNAGILENLGRLRRKEYITKSRPCILRPSVGPGGFIANIGFGTRALFSSGPASGKLTNPPERELEEPLEKDIVSLLGADSEAEGLSEPDTSLFEFGMEYSTDNEKCSMSSGSVQADETQKSARGNEPRITTPSLSTAGLNDTRGDASSIENNREQPSFAELETKFKSFEAKKRHVASSWQNLDQRTKRIRQRIRTLQTRQLVRHTKEQLVANVNQLIDDTPFKEEPNTSNGSKEKEFSCIRLKANLTSELKLKDKIISPPSGLSIHPASSFVIGQGIPRDSRHERNENKLLSAKSFLDELAKGQLKNCDDAKGVFNVMASNASRTAVIDDPEMTDTDSDGEEDIACADGRREKMLKRLYDTDPRWHRDRVQIGAKFTWIQAQIADLNHKIKRYGDLYQQLRSSRQRVTLEDKTEKDPVQTESTKEVVKEHSEATATSSVNSMLPINKNIQNSQKNGLIKHLAKSADGPEDRSEKGCCSARTLVTTRFPKHRYIKQNMRPEPLLVKSEKCQCPDLSTPFLCAKCHKATLEGHRKSSGKQLAASLDDSYHSQLSFDFDVLLPYHLEETLRKGELDMRIKPLIPAPNLKKRDLLKKKVAVSKAAISNLVASEKLVKEKKSPSLSDSYSSKLKKLNHLNEDSETDDLERQTKRPSVASAALQLHKRAISLRTPGGSGDSRPSTPVGDGPSLSQSHPASSLAQIKKKSSSRPSSEFDINNIVIPYSITSAVRLEKLQYKEIPTPGWRHLNEDDIPEKKPRYDQEQEEEEFEDITDEGFAMRHAVCEVAERKKFSTYYKIPPIRRSRSSRKSSECNTPEPPHSPGLEDSKTFTSSFSGLSDSSSTVTTPVLATPTSGKLNKGLPWLLPLCPAEEVEPPWTKRQFPLSENDLTLLNNAEMPLEELLTVSTDPEQGENVTEPSRTLPSDLSSSDNDLDDKWTVKLVTEEQPVGDDLGTARKGIVLKLAKQ